MDALNNFWSVYSNLVLTLGTNALLALHRVPQARYPIPQARHQVNQYYFGWVLTASTPP